MVPVEWTKVSLESMVFCATEYGSLSSLSIRDTRCANAANARIRNRNWMPSTHVRATARPWIAV